MAYMERLADGNIAAYTRWDTRFGRRAGESLESSLTAANLPETLHAEFPDECGLHSAKVPRSVFGKILWRF